MRINQSEFLISLLLVELVPLWLLLDMLKMVRVIHVESRLQPMQLHQVAGVAFL